MGQGEGGFRSSRINSLSNVDSDTYDSQPYYCIDGAYYVASDKEANLPEENSEYKSKPENSEKSDPEMVEAEDHNYEVVGPPVGATVPYLPEKAEKKEINNKTYYLYDKTYYRAYASDGDNVYMVVDDPTKPSK